MTLQADPLIKKAARITGKTLVLRDALRDDAGFVLSLRTDERKGQYLSPTTADVSAQESWLAAYATRAGEAYFIIENTSGEPLGTVRLYDAKADSFCWGSWIIKNGAPTHTAIESALMVYAYALDVLGFASSHFDVRRGNESVWRFHEKFGACRVGESDADYFYRIGRDAIEASRLRYRKFLPEAIGVEGVV